MTTNQQLQSDKDLIAKHGGPSAFAKKLGFASKQRVHNWMTRGIPPSIKLAYPKLFLKSVVKK
jgi:hypothetical protein